MSDIEILESDNDPGTETLETISIMRSYALVEYNGKELLVPYKWESYYAEGLGEREDFKFKEIEADEITDENEVPVTLSSTDILELSEMIEEAM